MLSQEDQSEPRNLINKGILPRPSGVSLIFPNAPTSENRLIKSERSLSLQACNILKELRSNSQLCDAILTTDDKTEFYVHRAILAASSRYFRALFTNGMDDTNYRQILVPGVESEILKCLIDWCYTRQTTITSENIERLLPAADKFQILGLIEDCCDFLKLSFAPENIFGIRKFSGDYFCSNLKNAATSYIMNNFVKIASTSKELLELNINDLIEILSADELNVNSEQMVFETIIKWIDLNPNDRKQHITRLLKCVRAGLLDKTYFIEIVKAHPYVKESDDCKPLVIEILKYLYELDLDFDRTLELKKPFSRPRLPHELLFAFGGWSGGSPTPIVEVYDCRADRWTLLNCCDRGPRAYHGCVAINNQIYIIGGFDSREYFNTCKKFDPRTRTWSEIAPMHIKRCYVSVAAHKNFVYAMGGFDGHLRQNTAEKYDIETNQWTMIANMYNQRSDASAATLNDKIYICGGFNGQDCLSTVEYYCPNTNSWTLVEPMRNKRSGVSVITSNNTLYALGGFNGIIRMRSAEKYDPKTGQWTYIAEMNTPRSNFTVEVLDGKIYAIGGFNGVTTIYNVESYNSDKDKWSSVADMHVFRSALNACVLSDLSQIRDYLTECRGYE